MRNACYLAVVTTRMWKMTSLLWVVACKCGWWPSHVRCDFFFLRGDLSASYRLNELSEYTNMVNRKSPCSPWHSFSPSQNQSVVCSFLLDPSSLKTPFTWVLHWCNPWIPWTTYRRGYCGSIIPTRECNMSCSRGVYLQTIFGDQIILKGLWLPCLLDFLSPGFFGGATLKMSLLQ
jgi:hypothetical protein